MRRLATAARVVAAVCLGAACYWSLRLAYADLLARRDSIASIDRAIGLAPGNAAYQIRRAELAGGSAAGLEALKRAVEINPRDSAAWMELGLRAEQKGELGEAERCLEEAGRVDKTYAPRSTLTNYYFRRGDEKHFWPWARQALMVGSGDAAPLFRLCWSLTEDAGLILERAIPDRPEALRQYLSYLLASARLEAAKPVAERVGAQASAEDAPLLLAFCDASLDKRDGAAAVRIWNAMAARGVIEYPALGGAVALTNGNFATAPRSQGFDWRLTAGEGVSISRDERAGGLRIRFTGKQPEACEPLAQLVPLRPRQRYLLRLRYSTEGIGPGSGLRWRVYGLSGGSALVGESEQLSSEETKELTLRFSTPEGAGLSRLALSYQRSPGTARIVGSVTVRDVGLTLE